MMMYRCNYEVKYEAEGSKKGRKIVTSFMEAPKSSFILLLVFHFLIVLEFEDIFSFVPPINQYLFILNEATFNFMQCL